MAKSPNTDAPGSDSQDKGSSLTRASLISRARNRDEAAWCELVDLYGPLIAHWCHRYGFDSHATADCVQEVFSAVSRSLAGYRSQGRSGGFRSWLWTITSNKVRDRIRREHDHDRATGGSTALANLQTLKDPQAESFSLGDEEPTSGDDLRGLMARAMEQVRAEFETKSWEIFLRSTIDQIPTQVVAEQFGVTSATVRQVRSRIMRRLRKQLGDGPEDG